MNSSNSYPYEITGQKSDVIDFKISYRIIQLFSEGLYSSPNKAIEELVSNSFDANAKNVHIILSPDLHSSDATIVVIDDGEGMDNDDLKNHWIIGRSTKRTGDSQNRRKPIGKFGIGKLSTYVLASKFTHITKSENVYYAATMDYSDIPKNNLKGVFEERKIQIPLRKLTENEARNAVKEWTRRRGTDYKVPTLFGKKAPSSWTVAIMSQLKEMGKKIKLGRLQWVLRTAMPQCSDFRLFLDGKAVTSPQINEPVAKMVLGRDIVQMPPPCSKGLVARPDHSKPKDSIHRDGIYHNKLLGRITGYIEIFKNEIDKGKAKFERSNGFFIYVNERQVNVEDPGFGIERNLLRHGTFSRFRMVVHIDCLDEILRSSRESFQQGELYEEVQNFLRASFNFARNRLMKYDQEQTSASRISSSISFAPRSITRKPLLGLARMFLEGRITPFYLRFPSSLSEQEKPVFLSKFEQEIDAESGLLQSTELQALDPKEGIAVLDVQERKLLMNSSHPFVASFQESFTNPEHKYPLEIFVISEILMEAHLYYMGLDKNKVREIISRRDELLRYIVKVSAHRTASMIAMSLKDAHDNAEALEKEMRAAFEAMGFDNVIRIGGKNSPDGTAEAYLAAKLDGTRQQYKVGLEAKSGSAVSAKRLNISGIARHMRDYNCDHHLVIGNSFATSSGENSATVTEIREQTKHSGKTITLMHIGDLARLVRITSIKRTGGLGNLRELFRECVTPEESKAWINELNSKKSKDWPYRQILETIWKLARQQPEEAIEYAAVIVELRHCDPPVDMKKQELIDCCKAMQVMVTDVVFARDETVEIGRRPDLILKDIKNAIKEHSEEESKSIHI